MLAALAVALFAAYSPAQAPKLVLLQRVEHVGEPAGIVTDEPMLAQLPSGTLFVAGNESPAPDSLQDSERLGKDDAYWLSRKGPLHDALWKSEDSGRSWSLVDLGPSPAATFGNSDVDLAAAPDGTLYFATMRYDATASKGSGISVGVSHDAGATWVWTAVSRRPFDDRPWVVASPDGSAHVIWNRADGVFYSESRDRGAHWSPPRPIHPKGGSSHFAGGPKGELAARIVPHAASGNRFFPDTELIAVSTDGGRDWRKKAVPGKRDWVPGDTDDWRLKLPRWIEPLAWDAKDRLYYLWTDSTGAWLARSIDRGSNWKTWRVARNPGPCYFPYLAARGNGELAATWRCGKRGHSLLQVAHLQMRSGNKGPKVALAGPYQLMRVPNGGTWQGEYAATKFLSDGSFVVVTAAAKLHPDGWIENGGFGWWRFRMESAGDARHSADDHAAAAGTSYSAAAADRVSTNSRIWVSSIVSGGSTRITFSPAATVKSPLVLK